MSITSLGACTNCFDNPCTCGFESTLKSMSREEGLKFIKSIIKNNSCLKDIRISSINELTDNEVENEELIDEINSLEYQKLISLSNIAILNGKCIKNTLSKDKYDTLVIGNAIHSFSDVFILNKDKIDIYCSDEKIDKVVKIINLYYNKNRDGKIDLLIKNKM